jgi:FkbM family methyltransferase
MTIKALLRDWIPPAMLRMGRRLLPRPAPLTRQYRVGSKLLVLPANHALPEHQFNWPLYDTPIKLIADSLRHTIGEFRAIDIGANVGDTAAILSSDGQTPVLCIEGDPAYFWFLEQNAKTIGPQIVIEHCFVGAVDGQADASKLERHDGTTSAVKAMRSNVVSGLPVRRLESILCKHPDFETAQFIKIDTDGCDFNIILSHLPFLTARNPVLFFENVVDSPSNYDRSLDCIDALERAGYKHFLVFDNFGHFLLSTNTSDIFEELNTFLLTNVYFGTAVHYFDVCALPDAQQIVVETIREMFREFGHDGTV